MKQEAEAKSYTIELVPHKNSDKVEADKRRADVLDLLRRMHLRAKKKGRPSLNEKEFENAA